MIRVISSSNVLPNCIDYDHHDDDRLDLIPWDLIHLLSSPMHTCLIYHKARISSMDTIIETLKTSLSKALDIFYPLAGRLAVTEDLTGATATYSVDRRAGGATFVHAVDDDVTLADFLTPVELPRELLTRFYPMNGALNYEGVSDPLLAVQVTEIFDGVVLGLTASHVAMDGASFWHFVNSWSHIAGDQGGASPPEPIFDRRRLFDGILNLPVHVPFPYRKLPSLVLPNQNQSLIRSRIFRFSKETIAELKAKANSSAGDNGGPSISSFQAVLAHLWVSVTRSRRLDPAEEVTYRIVVGLRRRLKPALPESYFGNATRIAAAKSIAGEILSGERGFMTAAKRINLAISGQTPAEGRRQLTEWAEKPLLARSVARPANVLTTGSSPRFDMFGNDFGWGPPLAVRDGGFFSDGRVTPMPAPPPLEGTVDFEVFLAEDALLALGQDPLFVGLSSNT